ncbi:MAG: hypothetical protein Q9160_005159 [Pyrenula sp. 1 TL-2023]
MSGSEPEIASPELAEEILSVNAIYPDPLALTLVQASLTETTFILAHPVTPITFVLAIPAAYPVAPPAINGTNSIGDRPKGEGTAAVEVLRETVTKVWREGEVCLFDLLEEAAPLLEPGDDSNHEEGSLAEANKEETHDDTQGLANESSAGQKYDEPMSTSTNTSLKRIIAGDQPLLNDTTFAHVLATAPVWSPSQLVTSKKSSFLAHASPITSKAHALQCISQLFATNKKLATATHNITAYRVRYFSSTPSGPSQMMIPQQDCDDDGETAAGGRVLHLMQMMEAWDVVVVVSRWYGGVKLGPDRFRIINSVVREALVSGVFAAGGKEKGDETGGSGKAKGEKGKKGKK